MSSYDHFCLVQYVPTARSQPRHCPIPRRLNVHLVTSVSRRTHHNRKAHNIVGVRTFSLIHIRSYASSIPNIFLILPRQTSSSAQLNNYLMTPLTRPVHDHPTPVPTPLYQHIVAPFNYLLTYMSLYTAWHLHRTCRCQFTQGGHLTSGSTSGSSTCT